MAGKLSRIVAILKNAPRQIISAYRKGKSEAPPVPPPEALRKYQSQTGAPLPQGKDSQRK